MSKINKIFVQISALTASVLVPTFVFAQNLGNLKRLLDAIGNIVSSLLPILIGLGVVIFIWGLIKRLFSDDEAARKEGTKWMFWGILVIFISVSLVGLVQFIGNAIGIGQGGQLNPPCVQGLDC